MMTVGNVFCIMRLQIRHVVIIHPLGNMNICTNAYCNPSDRSGDPTASHTDMASLKARPLTWLKVALKQTTTKDGRSGGARQRKWLDVCWTACIRES